MRGRRGCRYPVAHGPVQSDDLRPLGSHPKRALQHDWQAYGTEALHFEVLEAMKVSDSPHVTRSDERTLLEQLWLAQLQPFGACGYNRDAKIRQRTHGLTNDRPAVRMGATPAALLTRLAALPLPWVGEPRLLAPIGLTGEPAVDLATLAATLATEVRRARAVGALPVVIGGDCLTAIGTLGGLDGAAAGIVWIDAHGDFNTPATTPSGYLGGMPLAALAGRCLPALTAAAGLRAPVPEERTALLGDRDLDPPEHAALAASQVAVLTSAQLRDETGALPPILARLGRQGPVSVHIDVDVLDPAVMPGVAYPAPGGLSLAELEALLRAVRAHCGPAAITLTAVNVTAGHTETILAAAARVVQAALGAGDGR